MAPKLVADFGRNNITSISWDEVLVGNEQGFLTRGAGPSVAAPAT